MFGLSLVWNRYPKVCHMSDTTGAIKRSIIAYDRIEFAKNKCLSAIWSTEMTPIKYAIKSTHFKNQLLLNGLESLVKGYFVF